MRDDARGRSWPGRDELIASAEVDVQKIERDLTISVSNLVTKLAYLTRCRK